MVNDLVTRVKNGLKVLSVVGTLAIDACNNGQTVQNIPNTTSTRPTENLVAQNTPKPQPQPQYDNPCNISFAGYDGVCRNEASDGSTVLVKEFSDGSFRFYRDSDNDGCFDTTGKGFYMLGLSRRFSESDLTPGQYCLDN